MNITRTETPHYTLNIGQTSQFKTIKIQITFNNMLREDTVTARALLPYIMKAATARYPRRKDIQEHLENLYSASFQAGVKKVGLSQEITFDLTLIDDSYVQHEKPLLEQGFAFLREIFFHPQFSDKVFIEEKRLLEEYFLSIYSNKMRYAMLQLHEQMYSGQAYALQPLGRAEDLADLSLKDIHRAYQNMLAHDTININIIGDVDPSEMESYVKTYLQFTAEKEHLSLIDRTSRPVQDVQHIVETQDVMQGKFVLGFQFPAYYTSEDYYRAVTFNTLLGGNPESLLFKRIREELNKVYFIGSSYDQYKGALYIYGGINPEEYDTVNNEITTILASIRDNTYPVHRLEIAKKTLINGLIESFDSPGSLASRVNHLSLFGKIFDADKLIANIKAITEEDISDIAGSLTLDTTFFLRGETT